MIRAIAGLLLATFCALTFYGASCGGGNGGGRDTGLDRDSGGSPQVEDVPKVSDFAPREFSGNGSTNIGTVKVPGDAIFEWTNRDDPAFRSFLAYDESFQLNVNSEAESGESVLPAGTYPNINVSGGDWTITIRPR